jgi:hypothetical protein
MSGFATSKRRSISPGASMPYSKTKTCEEGGGRKKCREQNANPRTDRITALVYPHQREQKPQGSIKIVFTRRHRILFFEHLSDCHSCRRFPHRARNPNNHFCILQNRIGSALQYFLHPCSNVCFHSTTH